MIPSQSCLQLCRLQKRQRKSPALGDGKRPGWWKDSNWGFPCQPCPLAPANSTEQVLLISYVPSSLLDAKKDTVLVPLELLLHCSVRQLGSFQGPPTKGSERHQGEHWGKAVFKTWQSSQTAHRAPGLGVVTTMCWGSEQQTSTSLWGCGNRRGSCGLL